MGAKMVLTNCTTETGDVGEEQSLTMDDRLESLFTDDCTRGDV